MKREITSKIIGINASKKCNVLRYVVKKINNVFVKDKIQRRE
jgi:hypothetical protein